MAWKEKWIKYVVIVMVLISQSGFLVAQDAPIKPQEVDSAWWNNTTKDVSYFEEAPEEVKRKFKVDDDSSFDWESLSFLKYLVLFGIAAVLIFVLYRLYGQSMFQFSSSKKSRQLLNLSEEELDERFLELDLVKMLAAAIQQENWKMVVRLRFLQILKTLVDNQTINWHSDLTNRQISYQLKLGDIRTGFNSLVLIYEQAWYSNAQVNELFYSKVKLKFDTYHKLIRSHV